MKECPLCRRTYADEYQNFCLDDGAPLRSMSIHSTDSTEILQTSPNAPTLVHTANNDPTIIQTFSDDKTLMQEPGAAPTRIEPPRPVIPFYVYAAIALLVVIVTGGVLWWMALRRPPDSSESTIPAVRVGNELREEFRRSREKLLSTNVADFERAEEKVQLLRGIDPDNGRAWYFAGEIKRVKDTTHFDPMSCAKTPMDPVFDPDAYEQDFYRYLELAARVSGQDATDMSDQICYTRPDGVCPQRTAWIEHLLANDLYAAAMAATRSSDRNARLERAASHVKEALKYHQPEGSPGFDQCIDTLALEQRIKDATVQ